MKKTKPNRPAGTRDFFVRLSDAEAQAFDARVAAMEPKSSRSAVIAMLIRKWLAQK